MLPPELERQTTDLLETLRKELRGRVSCDDLETFGRRHYERLLRNATVTDYIPLLVYRNTKEDLLNALRPGLDRAA